jgi:hypothetical protein
MMIAEKTDKFEDIQGLISLRYTEHAHVLPCCSRSYMIVQYNTQAVGKVSIAHQLFCQVENRCISH